MKSRTTSWMPMLVLACFTAVSPLIALAQTAGTDYMGINYASVNLNIRSSPTVIAPVEVVEGATPPEEEITQSNLIGHYKQGETVIVTAVIGQWCKVEHEYLAPAYVYCEFLIREGSADSANAGIPADAGDGGFIRGGAAVPAEAPFNVPDATADSAPPVAPAEALEPADSEYPLEGQFFAVGDLMSALSNWLITEGYGKSHINDSYWKAYTKALAWRDDAKLADFRFEYPSSRSQPCNMAFSSDRMRRHYFKGWCLDVNSREIETIILGGKMIPDGFDPVSVTFSDFAEAIIRDFPVMEELGNRLEDGTVIMAYFRLYDRGGKGPVWEAKFVNASLGKTIFVRADANDQEIILELEPD